MGTINIYSSNGSNKAGLIYNGSGDITVDTEHLANTSSSVQTQLDARLPLAGGTLTGDLIINTSSNGMLKLQEGGNDKGYIGAGGGGLYIKNLAGDVIFRNSSDADTIRIKDSGNVGIGTNSPDSLLHLQKTRGTISGGSSDTGAVIKLHTEAQWESGYGNNALATTNDYLGSIEFSTGDGSTGEGVRAAIRGTVDSYYNENSIVFETCNQGDTTLDERMRVSHNGNVGIGTASPTDKFEIHHNDAYEFSLRFNQGNNNIVSGFGQQQSILAYADGASNTDQYYAGITFGLWDSTHNSKDGSIHFHTAVDSTVTTGLRITGTGEVLAALEPALNMAVGTTTASHAKLTVYSGMGDKPALLLSNADGGANAYANRNNRYLLSNGSNWIGDGKDPIAVIGTNSSSTDKFPSAGLVMHNESQTDNTFSTPIVFGNRSNSGAYNTAYAYIAGRKVGQGVDSNWSTGEIWIDTAGTKHNGNDAYMDHSPAIKIRNTGTVDMRWQPFSYGTLAGNGASTANGTGWGFSPTTTQGLSYNTNASHGPGFTVAEPGYYHCFATSLYSPGGGLSYVYIGWCINGTQIHHWHSNHTIESNHDFVSSIIRWCNAGDHITLENSSANVTSQWGGSHSQYHIWKVG